MLPAEVPAAHRTSSANAAQRDARTQKAALKQRANRRIQGTIHRQSEVLRIAPIVVEGQRALWSCPLDSPVSSEPEPYWETSFPNRSASQFRRRETLDEIPRIQELPG